MQQDEQRDGEGEREVIIQYNTEQKIQRSETRIAQIERNRERERKRERERRERDRETERQREKEIEKVREGGRKRVRDGER